MPKFDADLDLQSVARVKNSPDPTQAQHGATKAYVDAAVQGAKNLLDSAKVVATANVALSGLQNIDGVALVDGDQALLVAQTTTAQNGKWVAHAGAWTRPADFASGSVHEGATVYVEEGTNNSATGWGMTTVGAVTVDTTSQAWTQIFGLGEYTAGAGILINGRQISLDAPTTVARGGTGANSASGARSNLGATGKFAATIGDGAATTITVTHNLATTDVHVQVFTVAGGNASVMTMPDVTVVDANSVNVIFATAPATNSRRVVVIG